MRYLTFVLALGVAIALPALAAGKSDPGVTRSGVCSGVGANWKLKAKPDDGRLEVEFEVDQNRNGRRWNVVITRNGTVVFRGQRITRPPSGSFSLERRVADGAGSDRIAATARPAGRSGICRASLLI